MKNISSTKVASVAAGILNDKLASDIIILDISNVSVLADYFVIASADSSNQVKSLTNYVEEKKKKIFGKKPLITETLSSIFCIMSKEIFICLNSFGLRQTKCRKKFG